MILDANTLKNQRWNTENKIRTGGISSIGGFGAGVENPRGPSFFKSFAPRGGGRKKLFGGSSPGQPPTRPPYMPPSIPTRPGIGFKPQPKPPAQPPGFLPFPGNPTPYPGLGPSQNFMPQLFGIGRRIFG